MCDDSPAERRYWIQKIERLQKDMERERLERQHQAAAAPAVPAKPGAGVEEPQLLPV